MNSWLGLYRTMNLNGGIVAWTCAELWTTHGCNVTWTCAKRSCTGLRGFVTGRFARPNFSNACAQLWSRDSSHSEWKTSMQNKILSYGSIWRQYRMWQRKQCVAVDPVALQLLFSYVRWTPPSIGTSRCNFHILFRHMPIAVWTIREKEPCWFERRLVFCHVKTRHAHFVW